MQNSHTRDFKNGIKKRFKTTFANGAVYNGPVFDIVYFLILSSFKRQKKINFFHQRNDFYLNFPFLKIFYFVSIFFRF
jgi:hypothetical protein